MYAVIKTGGKQYRVKPGDVLKVELLHQPVGSEIDISDVLLVNDGKKTTVGTPNVDKACVKAKVLSEGRHKKIKIIKFKRRKHHMKQMGHRQHYSEIEITSIK